MAPRRVKTVAVLIFDGVPMFETAVPLSVFGVDRSSSGGPRVNLLSVAAERQPLITTGGISIEAPHRLERLPEADIVIVPGWRGPQHTVPPPVLRAVTAAHAQGAVLVGLSMGACVLAATGLLDGRRVAAHWSFASALAAKHPRIQVDPAVLYVDDGEVITSAGTAAGLDACIHVVARFWGVKAATAIARRMAAPPQRSGAEAQLISEELRFGGDGTDVSEMTEYIVRNLDQQIDITKLAARYQLSRRSFDRRFRAATGLSPLQWILHQRILRARHLLEDTDLTVEAIAHQIGLSKAVSLRPLFHRVVGVSPHSYRATFRTGSGED